MGRLNSKDLMIVPQRNIDTGFVWLTKETLPSVTLF
jgi:hypothetical protein